MDEEIIKEEYYKYLYNIFHNHIENINFEDIKKEKISFAFDNSDKNTLLFISRLYGKYGLIDIEKGKILSYIYDDIKSLQKGFLAVKKNGKYAIYDLKIKEFITNFEYDDVIPTYDRFFIVKRKDKYGVINDKNNLLIDYEYDEILFATYEKYKFLLLKRDNSFYKCYLHYNMKESELIKITEEVYLNIANNEKDITHKNSLNTDYDYFFSIINEKYKDSYEDIIEYVEYYNEDNGKNKRFFSARKNGKIGIVEIILDENHNCTINERTKFIYDEIFFDIPGEGYISVCENGEWYILNENFERFGHDMYLFHNIFERAREENEKILFLYKLKDKDMYLKYFPIYDFGNIIICQKERNILTYNKTTKEYFPLCSAEDFWYESPKAIGNFLVLSDKYYYIKEDSIVDLTGYIRESYEKKDSIYLDCNIRNWIFKFEKDIGELLSYEEFIKLFMENPNFIEAFERETEQRKKIRKENEDRQKREEREEKLRKVALQEREEALTKAKELQESIVLLTEHIKSLALLREQFNIEIKKIVLPEEALFFEKNGHKEIRSLYIENNLLKHINFLSISFDNVKVSGIDFTGCNASINPQTVYKKDMTNGIYSGLNFDFASFNGVNISGSDFSDCFYVNSSNAILDERTVLPNRMYK